MIPTLTFSHHSLPSHFVSAAGMEEARRREEAGIVILLSRSLSRMISLYKLHSDMMIRMTGACGGLSPVLDRQNISHPVSGWHSETARSSLTH